MDILLERKSIRRYTDEDIKHDDLEYILRAAMAAPTARNSRCYSFIVIKDKAMHEKIASAYQYSQMILNAPVAILVVGDKSLAYKNYLPQDCAASTQNILLAATARGYGSVWCGIYSDQEKSSAMSKLLNLPESIEPFSLVVIGKSQDNTPVKNRWQPDKIKYETW